MKLTLKRLYRKPEYIIGKLYIDGVYFCDTIEDRDRGLTQDMSVEQIRRLKVYGETAIPYGVYKIRNIYSPKFKKTLPLLLGVKGFEGIRIHSGNTEKDSLGCIIVGKNKVKGKVLESRAYMDKLMDKILGQSDLTIEITK